jgi:hypothetical protein
MAERGVRSSVAGSLTLALALATSCGPGRVRPPPRVACEVGTQQGLPTRHLAWNGHGWSALVLDGHTLYLRDLRPDGGMAGEPLALSHDADSLERAALAVVHGTQRIAFATREDGTVQVVRVAAGSEPTVASLDAALSGRLAVVARPAVSGTPAAVFLETLRGTERALIDDDGDLGAMARCPRGVAPDAVAAAGEGFVALVAGAHGGLSAVWLDDQCRERSRMVLSEEAGEVRWRELTADPAGPWVTFTDGRRAGWFAALGLRGELRVPPRRLEGSIERPSLLVGVDEAGALRSLTVLGIRRTEIDARLVTLHYDHEARFVDLRTLLNDPVRALDVVAPNPWGGALIGYQRNAVAGPTGYPFLLRMCP